MGADLATGQGLQLIEDTKEGMTTGEKDTILPILAGLEWLGLNFGPNPYFRKLYSSQNH